MILVLENWYSKLTSRVRWNNVLSDAFDVKSGVRQGGSLSPALFNIMVDPCITKIKETKAGCTMGGYFVGMIMYADDILLISPTVQGPQTILDKCSDVFDNIPEHLSNIV